MERKFFIWTFLSPKIIGCYFGSIDYFYFTVETEVSLETKRRFSGSDLVWLRDLDNSDTGLEIFSAMFCEVFHCYCIVFSSNFFKQKEVLVFNRYSRSQGRPMSYPTYIFMPINMKILGSLNKSLWWRPLSWKEVMRFGRLWS